MKFKIVDFPVKHLIVEGFLNKQDLYNCKEELINLFDSLHEGNGGRAKKGLI